MDYYHYMPKFPDYMKTHVLHHSDVWHIYWNYFRIPYKRYGLNFYKSKLTNSLSLGIYFGKGEIGISFYYENLFKK